MFISFPPGISSEKDQSNVLGKKKFWDSFPIQLGFSTLAFLFFSPMFEDTFFSQLGWGGVLLMTWLG